jgi:hypothetical protein
MKIFNFEVNKHDRSECILIERIILIKTSFYLLLRPNSAVKNQ